MSNTFDKLLRNQQKNKFCLNNLQGWNVRDSHLWIPDDPRNKQGFGGFSRCDDIRTPIPGSGVSVFQNHKTDISFL